MNVYQQAIATIKGLALVLAKRRGISDSLISWLEAAIAILEFAEASERWAHSQANADEINLLHDAAKIKISRALQIKIL